MQNYTPIRYKNIVDDVTHVVALGVNGEIYHTMRRADGSWPERGTQVLSLGGSRSAQPFKDALSALHAAIPHARRVELPHLGHLAADNGGEPDLVAQRLRNFFQG